MSFARSSRSPIPKRPNAADTGDPAKPTRRYRGSIVRPPPGSWSRAGEGVGVAVAVVLMEAAGVGKRSGAAAGSPPPPQAATTDDSAITTVIRVTCFPGHGVISTGLGCPHNASKHQTRSHPGPKRHG